MHASRILFAFGAAAVMAAPAYPNLDTDASMPNTRDTVHDYFTLLASKVSEIKAKGAQAACDLSTITAVPGLTTLLPPSPGLHLKHVAIGRGTQNYTCDPAHPEAEPKANGAIATLFDGSCLAASQPDLLASATKLALAFYLPPGSGVNGAMTTVPMAGANIPVSGFHYFDNGTPNAPVFNLDVSENKMGIIPCTNKTVQNAPADAQKGPKGEAAVPWLKLNAKAGLATGGLSEVYRIQTAGGSAPKTCAGLAASFEVQYSTQYWFWST